MGRKRKADCTPEEWDKQRELAKLEQRERRKDPAIRERERERAREYRKDPDVRDRLRKDALERSPAARARERERIEAARVLAGQASAAPVAESPAELARRERRAEWHRRWQRDPAVHARRQEQRRERRKDPAVRERERKQERERRERRKSLFAGRDPKEILAEAAAAEAALLAWLTSDEGGAS